MWVVFWVDYRIWEFGDDEIVGVKWFGWMGCWIRIWCRVWIKLIEPKYFTSAPDPVPPMFCADLKIDPYRKTYWIFTGNFIRTYTRKKKKRFSDIKISLFFVTYWVLTSSCSCCRHHQHVFVVVVATPHHVPPPPPFFFGSHIL